MNNPGHSYQFQIASSDAGQRLDEFFASRFGNLSRMRIANLIEGGACLVNRGAGPAGYRIREGDLIEVSFDDGSPTAMSPEHIPLDVIHDDEHLIVVIKPAGMLVHPTMSVKSGTLANALSYYLNSGSITGLTSQSGSAVDQEVECDSNRERRSYNAESGFVPDGSRHRLIRPGIVHRLDRATSGIMVVARTQRALTVLSRHFRKRLVEKRYVGLVSGNIESDIGSINAPIGRDPNTQPHWRIMEGGKPAETRFRVIERLERATLLELEPVTGRTNQLRIHCAHLGHPIVGDEAREDGRSQIPDRESNSGTVFDAGLHGVDPRAPIRHLPQRLCLHAWKLGFHHPEGGEWMEFTSPVPEDIVTVITTYRTGTFVNSTT